MNWRMRSERTPRRTKPRESNRSRRRLTLPKRRPRNSLTSELAHAADEQQKALARSKARHRTRRAQQQDQIAHQTEEAQHQAEQLQHQAEEGAQSR